MNLTNSPASRPLSSLSALSLRVAGIIVTLSAVIDMLILPIPYQFGERVWQLAATTQIVDRGLVPLVGLALLFSSYWVENSAGIGQGDRPLWATLRFWAAILASILGLLYVVLFPLHLNNVRLNNAAVQEQLTQEAEAAEGAAQQQLLAQVQQRRLQIGQLLQAPDEQLDEAVAQNLLSAEDADQVREFRENPETIDPFLQEQAQASLAEELTRIQEQRETEADATRTDSFKSGFRVGLNSLLLAVGYIVIGWFGLRFLGQTSF
ncbi:MAG: HpsJ family protein [Cyanobacteria bacterium J06638_20]